MIKRSMVVFCIFFILAGACLADEIKGKVEFIDKSKNVLQISGVIIYVDDAWMENEQDYPLALAGMALGDYVEVDGRFIGLSEMKARKVDRNRLECGAIKSKIATIDVKKREIIISGITIKVSASAWLEGPDHVKIPLELFAPGYEVICKGDWTGPSELTAFKVTIE